MNSFEEFPKLVKKLHDTNIRYAFVAGVAMAFYAEPWTFRNSDTDKMI